MRKCVITGALVSLLAFPVVADARTTDRPYLSVTEAKSAAEAWSHQWTSGFTESPAQVTERCRKVGRDRARCRVRIVADRLNATVRLVIRETRDDYLVSASDLRVK